ncbi:uncharacterized protein [Chiloscyllium punctatum]|uniref:uncharacterized protein n=1 Tax=Chiloscyllium punctatum TaxID=137246 RepID=UPI003B632426
MAPARRLSAVTHRRNEKKADGNSRTQLAETPENHRQPKAPEALSGDARSRHCHGNPRVAEQRLFTERREVCYISDPDLDGYPPRPTAPPRDPPPYKEEREQTATGQHLYPRPEDSKSVAAASGSAESPVASHTCNRSKQEGQKKDSHSKTERHSGPVRNHPPMDDESDSENTDARSPNQVQALLVEVAGPDGYPMLVHQPWTMKDLESAYGQLPDPREVRGNKFTEEVTRFCTEFCPMSHEMKRLLGRKLGVDVTKVRYNWSGTNIHARAADPQTERNRDFNDFVTALATTCGEALPV